MLEVSAGGGAAVVLVGSGSTGFRTGGTLMSAIGSGAGTSGVGSSAGGFTAVARVVS